MNTGVTVKLLGSAWWPSSCLVAGCTLVTGTLTGFRSPTLTPGAVMFGAAAAWREVLLLRPVQGVQLPQHAGIFGALDYLLAFVMLGLVPTAGVSVTVCGFVGALGSVGTTMSGWSVFREEIAVLPGSHRPVQQRAWSLDRAPLPGAARIF